MRPHVLGLFALLGRMPRDIPGRSRKTETEQGRHTYTENPAENGSSKPPINQGAKITIKGMLQTNVLHMAEQPIKRGNCRFSKSMAADCQTGCQS